MYSEDWCNPMTAQDTLLTKIIEKYTLHPCVCSCCGTPVSLDSYFEQFDKFYKFCSVECSTKFIKEFKDAPINNKCRSATEQMIFNYLKGTYSSYKIDHNVSDVIPPYELDFVFRDKNLAIEYNGYLHSSDKFGKRQRHYQLNDKKKKTLLCRDLCWNLITINSSIGLFIRPNLSKEILAMVKLNVDKILNQFYYGYCINLVVDSEHGIQIIEEKLSYKKEKG